MSVAAARRALRSVIQVARDRSGASAVEFGLIAPMMVIGLLGMIDVGRAVNERIALENVLRAGALIAMSDPGADAVRAAIGVIDAGQGAAAERGALSLDVQRYCACVGATTVAVDCGETCPGTSPTAIFYRLTSTTSYDGTLLPAIDLGAENRVRIR